MNILNPPVMIGDTIYKKCHTGIRKTPEEWKVGYLGWNGHNWDITVFNFDKNSTGTEVHRFRDIELNDFFWFTSAEACLNKINKENK